MTTEREKHVVFGGGQVGAPLSRLLRDGGHEVIVVKRTRSGIASGIELRTGDATDRRFCVEAARGATTIYHCMNPPYSARIWAELVPRFMDNVIAAAARSNARLVVLDNVYMLGRPDGRPLADDTEPNPCSQKGEIRAEAAASLFEAHRRGDVRATSGRASDFYGPGGTLTHLGDRFWPAVLAGRTARVVIDPDAVHTYHYIPDVAEGLATLGTADADAYGKPWMLPCRPAETLRELVERLSRALGSEIRLARFPSWMVKAVGLFVGLVREVDEMMYQWDEPFVIDDTGFRSRFGLEAEDRDVAAEATVRWAQAHYG